MEQARLKSSRNDQLPDPEKNGNLFARKNELVWAIRMTRPFTISQPQGGAESGKSGDYLVKSRWGELHVVPAAVFVRNYGIDRHHPLDHEPQYKRTYISNEELGGGGEPAFADMPGNAKIEARVCGKCGHTEIKETVWTPAGWSRTKEALE